jgi:hypothetical protein
MPIAPPVTSATRRSEEGDEVGMVAVPGGRPGNQVFERKPIEIHGTAATTIRPMNSASM